MVTFCMPLASVMASPLIFPLGSGSIASHFQGWFKDHVPNLELLTQGRELATWQMPWALTDSTNLKPRPSSPQVVLRFVNLLAMLS